MFKRLLVSIAIFLGVFLGIIVLTGFISGIMEVGVGGESKAIVTVVGTLLGLVVALVLMIWYWRKTAPSVK